jgi:hypothetical protein
MVQLFNGQHILTSRYIRRSLHVKYLNVKIYD